MPEYMWPLQKAEYLRASRPESHHPAWPGFVIILRMLYLCIHLWIRITTYLPITLYSVFLWNVS